MRKSAVLLLALFFAASCLTIVKPASSSAVASENTWTTKASMNEARRDFGVAVVDGRIYAIGGSNRRGFAPYTGGVVSTNEEYNPETDMWALKTPMPTPRASFATAVIRNKIYCIDSEVTEVYDPATDSWENKTAIPIQTSFSLAVFQDKIYCLSSETNQEYDPATDTWTAKAVMITPKSYMRTYVVGDKIYVMGGETPEGTLNEAYDPATDSWATKASMPYEAGGVSAVVDKKIYVINSYPSRNQSFNQIFDTETDTWQLGAPPPSLIGHVVAVSIAGVNAPKRIYILDGTPNAYGKLPHTNQVYDPETDSWAFGAEEPIEFNGFSVTAINDLVYAFGGWSITAPSDPITFAQKGYFHTVYSTNKQYTPFDYGTVPPKITVDSPVGNYTSGNVSLAFTMNKPATWMGYSLDEQDNTTISGNTTITDLKNGLHNVTVYARDEFDNTGASETIIFTVDVPEPFPIAPVAAAAIASAGIIAVGLLFYFKKRKR